MPSEPSVSVVVPTLHRPQLLMHALRSVFAQTHRALEIMVVVDGPDPETVAALESIDDPRLRFVVNPRSLTAAGARNAGVARTGAEWIAFLDDDDAWLPCKLERQLAFAAGCGAEFVSCLSRVVTPAASYVWPEVRYDNRQRLDEYLFDRRSVFAGASFVQTSSYLIRRTVFEALPFRTDTPHDDWDFLLRQANQRGTRLETVPEVLVEWHAEEQRPSLSGSGTWQASLAWLERVRPLMTRRAYSGFCLGVVGPRAAGAAAFGAFPVLLWRALVNGRPRPWHVAAYVAFWTVPQGLRRRLRGWVKGARPGASPLECGSGGAAPSGVQGQRPRP